MSDEIVEAPIQPPVSAQIGIRHLLHQAGQQWWQSYGNTDNRILRYCQILLMTVIICLGITSAGIQQALQHNMAQLLGADLIISHDHGLQDDALTQLSDLSSKQSLSKLIDATLTYQEHWQAVQIKVVDDAYPLRGEVLLTEELGGKTFPANSIPAAGEIWLDSRTFSTLKLQLQDTITLAGERFVVSAIITHEPDRLLEGHSVAHRAMIGTSATTDLLFADAQSTYRYGFEFDNSNKSQAIDWASQHLAHTTILHEEKGHPLARFWERVENFFGLVMVMLFFMAAITFSLVGKRHLEKQLFRFSLFLSFGITRKNAVLIWFGEWWLNFLVNIAIASAIAIGVAFVAMSSFASHLQLGADIAASFDGAAWLKAVALLAVLLVIFQIPFWLKLFQVSPAALLKNKFVSQEQGLVWVFNGLVICLLTLFYADNPLLTAMTLSALAATLLLMCIGTWLVLTLTEKVNRRFSSLFGFTLSLMKQRLSSKATQIMGLGLCMTLMLFSFGLMKDFSNVLGQYTRSHDGNLMISQATGAQVERLQDWAQVHGAEIISAKPYYRAKLRSINNEPLATAIPYASESATRMERPIRLHTTEALPANNRTVSGTFWTAQNGEVGDISVEEEVMTDLNLEIGDRLTFGIGEQLFDFTIRAAHVYRPGNGSITFWFQTPTYINEQIISEPLFMGSMELPQQAWPILADLWRDMPTLEMVTLKEMTERFDATLNLVQMALAIFSGLILCLSVLVIAATVQGFLERDTARNGLILSFGLNKQQCIKIVAYEWLVTGLIASLGSISGTLLIGNLMYQSQFSLTYTIDWVWLLSVTAITTSIVILLGLLFSRDSLKVSIRQLLAEE